MTRETKLRSLDADDFQTFTQVSKGLPGIKPRTVQKKLEALHETLLREKHTEGTLNGIIVTLAELEGAVSHDAAHRVCHQRGVPRRGSGAGVPVQGRSARHETAHPARRGDAGAG